MILASLPDPATVNTGHFVLLPTPGALAFAAAWNESAAAALAGTPPLTDQKALEAAARGPHGTALASSFQQCGVLCGCIKAGVEVRRQRPGAVCKRKTPARALLLGSAHAAAAAPQPACLRHALCHRPPRPCAAQAPRAGGRPGRAAALHGAALHVPYRRCTIGDPLWAPRVDPCDWAGAAQAAHTCFTTISLHVTDRPCFQQGPASSSPPLPGAAQAAHRACLPHPPPPAPAAPYAVLYLHPVCAVGAASKERLLRLQGFWFMDSEQGGSAAGGVGAPLLPQPPLTNERRDTQRRAPSNPVTVCVSVSHLAELLHHWTACPPAHRVCRPARGRQRRACLSATAVAAAAGRGRIHHLPNLRAGPGARRGACCAGQAASGCSGWRGATAAGLVQILRQAGSPALPAVVHVEHCKWSLHLV